MVAFGDRSRVHRANPNTVLRRDPMEERRTRDHSQTITRHHAPSRGPSTLQLKTAQVSPLIF